MDDKDIIIGQVQYELNYFSFIYIILLIVGLASWLIVTIWTLLVDYSSVKLVSLKPVVVVPFLMILILPPIISLTVILLRALYTRFSKSHFYLAPLDLSSDENQRQIFLLPLSVCGLTMTILPAYYIQFREHWLMLAALGLLGLLCFVLFLTITLAPESPGKGQRYLVPVNKKL